MKPLRTFFLAPTLVLALTSHAALAAERGTITVWKSPWCGCCQAWADAVEKAGFDIEMHDVEDLESVKKQAGVPDAMQACHTAAIDGYFLEGHVPLEAVDKLLSERPEIAGIAVPGMPQGSLGMGHDPDASYLAYAVGRKADAEPTVFYRAGR